MNTLKKGAIIAYREEVAKRLAVLRASRDDLSKKLLAAIPNDLKPYFEKENSIILDILNNGHTERECDHNHVKQLNCRDLKTVQRRFDTLNLAWEGVIQVTTTVKDGYCLIIAFQAI
ncbi:MAG: hypothetical protein WCX71_01430 [Candidatus Buchananbacteria bacterium]